MQDHLYCGIDIGSVAVKVVCLSPEKRILKSHYRRSHGHPAAVLKAILEDLDQAIPLRCVKHVAVTGSGGKLIAARLGCRFVNEIVSLIKANAELLPAVSTVIEMGGEDSKLLLLQRQNGSAILEDFAMNTLCAAGTGSFLDQQAGRLGLDVEKEFGELALRSQHPPRIAGRCSVFAKSDMIHLQQTATPDYDIVAGLCHAVARNFKSNIAKGKRLSTPIAFEGGVAANEGMVRAFTDVLGVAAHELIVPEHYKFMSALGAAFVAMENGARSLPLDPDKLSRNGQRRLQTAERLLFSFPDTKFYDTTGSDRQVRTAPLIGYLGVDVGSLSTNVVVIDAEGRVLARRYLMTSGRPLEAVRKGLQEVGAEIGAGVDIQGCGTTGSGRYLVGDFIGADIVRNEITAQAVAAIHIDPRVDTIFEIGGQDSKYISIDDGVVVDFEMNKACAAGTGSFLQEQAEKLDIRIEEEFGNRALAADCPVGCGERCTVFMESDLVSHQQAGAAKDDLVAGLAYSIVKNYLTRVVAGRRIGKHVFFQGGVAWNKGVVAAFEMVLGQKITVPPHHDVTGAIGAALLASQSPVERTRFKGFDISRRPYAIGTFVCEDCSNMCTVRQVDVAGEDSLYYGSRCEKYDSRSRAAGQGQPDLFRLRDKLLYRSIGKRRANARGGIRIGLPRTTLMFELLPFWATLFRDLGFRTIVSRSSNTRIAEEGLELSGAESCFPIKITYGHVMDLVRRGVDYVFLPSIIKIKDKDADRFGDFVCPYVQALPYTVRAGIDFGGAGPELLTLPVLLRYDARRLERELAPLRKKLSVSKREMRRAIATAVAAQEAFRAALQSEGRKVLRNLPADRPSLVVVSRPYNGCDPKLSLDIPKRVSELGALAIPLDFLPGADAPDGAEAGRHDNMYWRYGKRILAASDTIRRQNGLYALYVTNFGCGPDSFITHFFKQVMAGKPHLQIEVDEHSADAGIITRIEAFLDSLHGSRSGAGSTPTPADQPAANGSGRRIYVPHMCDHAQAFAAAFRACGVDAEALPESTGAAADLGRNLTLGKECFPCLLTIGDIVSKIKSPGFDRSRAAFFMPSASGPCRFGQYHRFQRLALDQLGYADVPLFSPDARNSYANFGFLDNGERFRKLGWQGLIGTDLLYRLRCRIKPYEKRIGETEAVYQRALGVLAEAIERQDDVCDAVGRCADMFARIEVDRSRPRPLVGVVGEIYLRQNRYANNDLVAALENLGAEVALAPMTEWIFYTNFTYKRRLFRERNWRDLVKAVLTDVYQRSVERRFTREVNKRVPLEHESPIEKVVELASPYLDKSFLGEAILSVGKSIDYYRRGARGIVNAMPFTCMPGTIVTAISRKVRRDCGNIPWLNMSYEGLETANDTTRLEAFVYQAARFRSQADGDRALTECDAGSERRSDRSLRRLDGKVSLPAD